MDAQSTYDWMEFHGRASPLLGAIAYCCPQIGRVRLVARPGEPSRLLISPKRRAREPDIEMELPLAAEKPNACPLEAWELLTLASGALAELGQKAREVESPLKGSPWCAGSSPRFDEAFEDGMARESPEGMEAAESMFLGSPHWEADMLRIIEKALASGTPMPSDARMLLAQCHSELESSSIGPQARPAPTPTNTELQRARHSKSL